MSCEISPIWGDMRKLGNRKKDTCDAYHVFGKSGMVVIAPYTYGDNIDQSQVIFSQQYLLLVSEGLLTGNISGMNEDEKKLFKEFIDYQDGWDELGVFTEPAYFTGDDLMVAESLDECLVQAVYGNETVQCGELYKDECDSKLACCPF